jgi:N-acylneuraminate-9-phosphatase
MVRQGHNDAAAATRLQHGCGLATAIITNGHRVVQRLKLEACQAARIFTHMLVGGEEIAVGCGYEKPHPAIFHK